MVEITLPILLQIVQTLGILVGIVYYITIMRNSQRNQQTQLETRQAQLFMQIQGQFNTPSMVESRDFYYNVELSSFEDYVDVWTDPEKRNLHRLFGGFLEGLGVMVRMKYIDIELIVGLIGGVTKHLWERHAPYILEYRERMNIPRAWIEWEYIYDEIMSYAEKHPELGIQYTEYRETETR